MEDVILSLRVMTTSAQNQKCSLAIGDVPFADMQPILDLRKPKLQFQERVRRPRGVVGLLRESIAAAAETTKYSSLAMVAPGLLHATPPKPIPLPHTQWHPTCIIAAPPQVERW